MKTYILIVVTLMTTQNIIAQSKANNEPYLVRNLSADNIKTVVLETTGGNISVNGTSGNARLEVYVSSNKSKESLSHAEIKQRLDEQYELEISSQNNKLTAKAKSKKRNMDWNQSLNISFKAYVPTNSSATLSTSGGNITMKDLSGAQDFRTSGGNLHLEKLGGNIKGRTSGGNIDITNSKAEIELATSGGNIDAADLTGNVRLTTSGGGLSLNSLKGNIYAVTSGGSVHGNDIEGELITKTSGGSINLKAIKGSLETSTSGGSIRVSFIDIGKYIKIDNSAGNIHLEIPGNEGLDLKFYANKISTEALRNFTGTNDDETLNGKLNGGGIPVIVNADSGKITLTIK